MEDCQERVSGNGWLAENGHHVGKQSPRQQQQGTNKLSLSWLDLRVFYVRVTRCEMDDSIPEYLALNHVPLNHDTLLEVNGVRTSIHSDGVSTLLRRDRLDKKSEEVTFVSTDTVRTTGSIKFEVFVKDVLMLSGALELSSSNGFHGESSESHGHCWSINCESDIPAGTGFLKGNPSTSPESVSPGIEVYVAGCFMGCPIILTKTVQLSHKRKAPRITMLESIPEHEATASPRGASSGLPMQVSDYQPYTPENEGYGNIYPGMDYLEDEDGELSWFNAGVRVGVGIGLSICVGIGVGVGLLVKTYQGTTRGFRGRIL